MQSRFRHFNCVTTSAINSTTPDVEPFNKLSGTAFSRTVFSRNQAMSSRRVHCQVLEVGENDHLEPHYADGPRDLLPWADPYISALLERVERQYLGPDEDWS